MKSKYLIFDLDDTLVYEIDYLKSGYHEIALKLDPLNSNELFERMWSLHTSKQNVFKILINLYSDFSVEELLEIYRNHYPSISLVDGAKEVLEYAKSKGYSIGLISDGRSVTQRNKLKALAIENFFDKVIISEEFGSAKPDERNFKYFMEDKFGEYIYVADNLRKDFVTPNRLNCISICLMDRGWNIHPQSFDNDIEYLPKLKIEKLIELKKLI